MSRLAAADRVQSTEECLIQERMPASDTMGLNTVVAAVEGMQLSSRELSSDVWMGENPYIFYKNEKTPLDNAVRACDVKFLDIFLDRVDLDEHEKTRIVNDAYTNFFHCEFNQITKDHIAMIKRLLELEVDVNGGPLDYPLSVAATSGSYPLVELLCLHGADVNKTDTRYRDPPLTIAVEGGHYDMIEVMLKFGANVNEEAKYNSLVYQAIVYGYTDCAKLLLQHCAHFDIESFLDKLIDRQSVAYINFLIVNFRQETENYISKHQQDLLIDAVRGHDIEFISHVIDIVFGVTGEDPCWEELLAESRNREVTTFIIQKGADVNKLVETYGYTPLYLVLGSNYLYHAPTKARVVKVLLENGASPNIHGDTSPLMLAALTYNNTYLLHLLLDHGADINWRDSEGDTAFSYSVYQSCDSNAEFLIRCAKDKHFINSQNNEGLTALMQAARYSNVAVVKGVISHNPDMNMTDNNGNTALLHAVNRTAHYHDRFRTGEIVTALITAGCDVNMQNDDGLSPLMLAASRYSTEVVQILLDAGADINAINKKDRTKTAMSYFQPESYSHNKDVTACLKVFLARGACLSYLQPKMTHRILLCNDSDTVCRFLTIGTGPMTVRSDEYFYFFSPVDPQFDISPLCTALLSGNVSLAHHLVDIMWLTKYDLTSLTHNKHVRSYLEKKNRTQCLNLLDEMSSQPVSLFRLAFVEVSSAVGTTPGRENRVNKLPLPRLLKDKLLFKSSVDFIAPTMDRIHLSLLPFDPSPKISIRVLDGCKRYCLWRCVLDSCKYCRVLQSVKRKR